MSKRQATLPPTSHPPLGTLIDNNSLQLIEVLGVGGYGVVYRAIETFPNSHRSFAVKCLINAHGHSLRRQIHIREISLHQLASAHPSIVSLYRVVEELDHIFIIMEFATNDDLFTQILHKCRYLGDNGLIKHVFLQLIDGMQYCHSLGIYHRDLKPENVLCFDGGFRVAITDFGLATTDKTSKEFRTGSIYHMSPECQVDDTVNAPAYSPKHNDIWSLGIILLNLITGRNPWKSATADDPTYQAYRQNPHQFLTSVLPISQEINHLLVQILNVDWRQRLSLSELRANIQKINNFYSDTVVFEGSLARCPWEAGLDLGTGVKEEKPVEKRPVPEIPGDVEPYRVVSMSAVVSNFQSQPSMVDSLFERETWDGQHSEYDYDQYAMDAYEDDHYHAPYKSSGRSSYSSDPSEPTTPSSAGRSMFGSFQDSFDLESVYDVFDAKHYDNESAMAASYAGTSGTTDTEDTQYASSSVFLATPIAESKPFPHCYDAAYVGYRTPEGYSPNASIYDPSFSSTNDPTMEEFPPISPNYTPWSEKSSTRKGSRPIKISGSRPWETKNKSHNLFNPMRFFPRSSGNSWLNPKVDAQSYSRAQPPNIRMHQPVQQPRETSGMTWTDHHYLPTRPSATKTGTGNRYPPTKTGGYGSRPHRARDWGPGQFYDANET